jgi:hypothetical protein
MTLSEGTILMGTQIMGTKSALIVRPFDVSGRITFQFLFQFQCQDSFFHCQLCLDSHTARCQLTEPDWKNFATGSELPSCTGHEIPALLYSFSFVTDRETSEGAVP